VKNNKSLGQHWLKNRAILDEIADVAATDINEETVCLEIGPGLGTLTSSLLKRFSKVIAVEFDKKLAENLPKSFPGKNLEVVCGDILSTDVPALVRSHSYVVVGNIPYYITSPIIRQMISLTPAPQRIVLLTQKEVAERVAADAGNQSVLSLLTQNRAEVELGPVVKAEEFTPPPKVDSQVLILTPLAEPQVEGAVLEFARKGFSNPRKKLSSNLADGRMTKSDWENALREEGINSNARAEDLSLWDWENLYLRQNSVKSLPTTDPDESRKNSCQKIA